MEQNTCLLQERASVRARGSEARKKKTPFFRKAKRKVHTVDYPCKCKRDCKLLSDECEWSVEKSNACTGVVVGVAVVIG